mgnify:CR=1 FL=1
MIIPKGSHKLVYFDNKNANFNLSTANVNDIFEDKDNNLWIGCYKKGVYMISQKKADLTAGHSHSTTTCWAAAYPLLHQETTETYL